jgi:hypothetical protein
MKALQSFDEAFPFGKSVHILKQLCLRLLPPSHQINRWIEEENWLALATAKVDYSSHLESSTVKSERQCLAFFQKNASLPLGIDRRAVAKQKFISAERDCLVQNWKLQNQRHPSVMMDTNFLAKVAWKIAAILGPAPALDQLDLSFGPGVNVGTMRRQTSARAKMSVPPTYSTNAGCLLEALQGELPHWDYLAQAKEANYGKLAFVAKDAKTDRTIETQPLVNSVVQLGIGKAIKRLLRNAGCDLYHGQAKNAEYARLGSLNGSYATIDLSSASDTISYMLVLELLPEDWFLLLDSVRTPNVKLGKEIIPLQKFAAMGNGCTFELETLIFYAICLVESGTDVHCYGDDIIVPSADARRVMRRLEQCGFTVNTDKSYWDGRFRESCGKDFFDGVLVRPVYVKGLLSLKELFRLHNFFFRRGEAYLADTVKRFIPKRLWKMTGPDGFGDGHLLSLRPNLVPHGRELGWGGYTFRQYVRKPRVENKSLRGDYAAFLYLTRNSRSSWFDPGSSVRRVMYYERGDTDYVVKRVYTPFGVHSP